MNKGVIFKCEANFWPDFAFINKWNGITKVSNPIQKREGIDLVHDNVEQQLNQEVEVIQACQEKMRRLIKRAEQQLQWVKDSDIWIWLQIVLKTDK